MKREIIIGACEGRCADAEKGQTITIVDMEGGQVLDFFAESRKDPDEFLSPGVTIDCNDSLRLKVGDRIYSNLYQPMFLLAADDVGEHDLLHPCCRPEMYDFFYQNGEGHPNCLQNINVALGQAKSALLLAVIRKVIILIPLCFVLTHFLGFKGVYMSEGIADLVAGIITAIVIFKTFPKIFREREIEVKEKMQIR